MSTSDLWTHRDTNISTMNLEGFSIEAIDGSIGKIDEATVEAGSGHVVVDTGPWIFGKKVMLPAGVISSVDDDECKVYVNRTKEQIKNAPELDESLTHDEGYRGRLGSYYGQGGVGYRDWDDTV
jgi:hypothetical protein